MLLLPAIFLFITTNIMMRRERPGGGLSWFLTKFPASISESA